MGVLNVVLLLHFLEFYVDQLQVLLETVWRQEPESLRSPPECLLKRLDALLSICEVLGVIQLTSEDHAYVIHVELSDELVIFIQAVDVFFVKSLYDLKAVLLPMTLQAPHSFVLLILYRVSCLIILVRIELYLPLSRKEQCADAVKQSILPLSLICLPINVDLYTHSIGLVIFEVAPVNTVIGCLFSEAMT